MSCNDRNPQNFLQNANTIRGVANAEEWLNNIGPHYGDNAILNASLDSNVTSINTASFNVSGNSCVLGGNLNTSGGSGLSGVNAPSFDSSRSYGDNFDPNVSGGSGLGGINQPSFDTTGNSDSSGPGSDRAACQRTLASNPCGEGCPRSPCSSNSSRRSSNRNHIPPRPRTPNGDRHDMNVSGISGISSLGPVFTNSPSSSYAPPRPGTPCGDRLNDMNMSGMSGLSNTSAPIFNNSGSSACSYEPPPRPNTPLSDRMNMNYSGQSGLSGINAPSFNTSYSNSPPPRASTPVPNGACSRPATPRSDNLSFNMSGGSGLNGIYAPSFQSSYNSSFNASGGSGISGISAPNFQTSSNSGTTGSYQTPGSIPDCGNNLSFNGSGGSGISGISSPNYQTSSNSGTTGSYQTPGSIPDCGNNLNFNMSGCSGISGISEPSYQTSSDNSSYASARTHPSTMCGDNLNCNVSGMGGLSSVGPPSFNSSTNPGSCLYNGDNFNQSGSGLDGIRTPNFNSTGSSHPSPANRPTGRCGTNTNTCGDNLNLNVSGASGLSGVQEPSYNTSSGGGQYSNYGNNSGSGLSGINAPTFNSSSSGGACSRQQTSCSRPASAGQQSPCQPSPYGNVSGGSGLSGISAPGLHASTVGTPSLNTSGGSGLNSVCPPSFNSCSSNGNGPVTSTPMGQGQSRGGSQHPSPNMIEFSPINQPDLIRFSPELSSYGSAGLSSNNPGDISRVAAMAFGSQDSHGSSMGCPPGIRPLSRLRRTEGSILQEMVDDAHRFLQNMTGSTVPSPACSQRSSPVQWPVAVSRSPGPSCRPNSSIGNSTLNELQWGSYEENILNQFNQSGSTQGSYNASNCNNNPGNGSNNAGNWNKTYDVCNNYNMNLAATLPFANASLNSTGCDRTPPPVPPNNGSVCGRNNSMGGSDGDCNGGAGGGLGLLINDPNTSEKSPWDNGYNTSNNGCSPNPLMNTGNQVAKNGCCMRPVPMVGHCNRVFDLNRLRTWTEKTVAQACQGQCGKTPFECEEHTLKFLMGVVTNWRNLYSRKSDGKFNFLSSNHVLGRSPSLPSGGNDSGSCCRR